MQFQVVPVVLSLGGAFLFACNSSAQVRFDLDMVFDGTNAPPANPVGPWITATVDPLAPNQVLFTLEATAQLTGAEKVKQFYFNFDDSLDLSALGVTPIAATGAFEWPAWSLSENGLKADGDGKYDIRLDFVTVADLDLAFDRHDRASYLLTYSGVGSMDPHSFKFLSAPAGGAGPFYAAAHVQNTLGGGSAWLAAEHAVVEPVPEPSGALLLGLVGFSAALRRMVART